MEILSSPQSTIDTHSFHHHPFMQSYGSFALASSERTIDELKELSPSQIQTDYADIESFVSSTAKIHHVGIVKSISKTKKDLQLSPIVQKNLQLTQILKLIQKKVKTPRIYSEHFRRKKFGMKCVDAEEVTLSDEVLIFGNIKIESTYSDLERIEQVPNFNAQSRIQSIVQLIKYPYKQYLELTMSPTHSNQHHHFRFLVDYFRKIPNLNFQRLSRNLAEYSKLLQNRVLPHIVQVNRLAQESPEFANQMFLTFTKIEEEIKKRMQASVKGTSYYKFSLMKLNFQSKQLDLALQSTSYDLLDLIGIKEAEIHTTFCSNPQSLLNFETNYKGEQRIENTILQLEAITKQLHNTSNISTTLQTIDGIDIHTKCSNEYIYLHDFMDEVPCWIHFMDIIGVVTKYEVTPAQVQSVNEIRKGLNSNQNKNEGGVILTAKNSIEQYDGSRKQFESQMLKEIFIQQFYPEKMIIDNIESCDLSNSQSTVSAAPTHKKINKTLKQKKLAQ